MKIVVASTNPVKRRAVEAAFASTFPEETMELAGVEVASGVGDQPASDEATRRGARNRAKNAYAERGDADYWVGIEGGIETIGDNLMTFAWVAVRHTAGRMGEARTATLTLPPAIRTLIDEGLELGEANDRLFSTVDSKRNGGAFGLLTNGRYTRESVYTEAIILALVPLVNSLYRQSSAG